MEELVYKVVYTPSEEHKMSHVNFLCADDKVHIRLREYDHEEVIHGFIAKLTYVMTYLLNRYIHDESTADIVLKDFCEHAWDYMEVVDKVKSGIFGCKGVKISKCYRKIKQHHKNPLGRFALGTCPMLDESSLYTLEKSLRIDSLKDFLFNDAVEIVITKKKHTKDAYSKFVKKASRVKKPKIVKKELEVFDLV